MTQPGTVAHACNPSHLGSWDQEAWDPAGLGKKVRSYLKTNQSEKVGCVAQVE
jgi:hypothetical protein